MDLCIKYLSYDPNYNYDENDEAAGDEAMEQDDYGDDDKYAIQL